MLDWRKRLWPLRSFLVLLVLAGTLPFAILAFVVSWYAADSTRARQALEMRELTMAAAGAIEVALGNRRVLAEALAQSTALDRGDLVAFEREARRVAGLTGIDVLAATPDGAIFLNTLVPAGRPLPDARQPAIVARAMAAPVTFLIDAEIGPLTGRLVAGFVRRAAQADYVVASRVEVDLLAPLLRRPALWPHGFAALFDASGALVLQTEEGPDGVARLRLPSLAARDVQVIDDGTPGGLVAASMAVGDTGWRVAVGGPANEVAWPLQRAITTVVGGAGLSLLLALVLAALLGRFLIRQTQALVAAAEGEGVPTRTARVREIALLGHAIARAAQAASERLTMLARLRAATETAHLLAESVEARNRDLEETTGRLLSAQDDERRRIARDLHDSTVQELTAAAMELSRAGRLPGTAEGHAALAAARQALSRATAELRTVSFMLQPPLLDECGLGLALRVYAEGLARRHGIAVEVTVPGEVALPRAAETALFRVAQEALANVVRHSGSPLARLALREEGDAMVLEIADDGRGLGDAAQRQPGVGIAGMRVRMRQLGGELELRSGSDGTRVRAWLPLGAKSAAERESSRPDQPDGSAPSQESLERAK